MSQVPPEMERRMRNLQAVARHHAQRNGAPQATAQAGTGPGISRKWAKRLGTLGPIGVVLLFVLGKLSSTNFVRFSLGRENRDLGTGFILPRDRDVDVVTAVAMAGYIDPIDSPTTVTVQRTLFDGQPMLIRVDLIAARFDRKENIMVQAGDIIYLNPDAQWWFRRTFDRIIPELILFPYQRVILKAFGQKRQ